MRITLLFSVLACASTVALAGSAVLRGRSAGADERSAEESTHAAHAGRALAGSTVSPSTTAAGAVDSSASIPSYEEILNIFKRVGGDSGGNNNNNMNQRNGRKNRRRKKNKNNDSSSSSDKDTNVYDNASDIPKNEKLGFLWHLWYTKGIKYEARGSDFCVMCKGKSGCEKGDEVVTSHCNPNDPDMRWEYIKVKNGVGLMKTRYHNLCLEMNDLKEYRLQRCDEDEERQMFQGLSYRGKFKLHPYKRRFADKKQCISMLHHPLAKDDHDGEEIIDQPCYKPERTETVYWVADFRDEVEEEIGRKDYDCSKKDKCRECEGNCSDDNECKGDLVCYKRGDEGWRENLKNKHDPNGWAQIPGCTGMGKYGRNYCAKEKYVSPYSDEEIEAILEKND